MDKGEEKMKYSKDLSNFIWHMCFGSFFVGGFVTSLCLIVNNIESGIILAALSLLGGISSFYTAKQYAKKLDAEEEDEK